MAGQQQLSGLNIPPPQRTADTAHVQTWQDEPQRWTSLLIKDELTLYFNDRRDLHIKILFFVSSERVSGAGGSGWEAQGSFALQHMFVFRGFGAAFKSKCSRGMVNRGGVLSLRMPASYKVSLSLLIARHAQQRPLALEMKKSISNSSSVLLLNTSGTSGCGYFTEQQSLLLSPGT